MRTLRGFHLERDVNHWHMSTLARSSLTAGPFSIRYIDPSGPSSTAGCSHYGHCSAFVALSPLRSTRTALRPTRWNQRIAFPRRDLSPCTKHPPARSLGSTTPCAAQSRRGVVGDIFAANGCRSRPGPAYFARRMMFDSSPPCGPIRWPIFAVGRKVEAKRLRGRRPIVRATAAARRPRVARRGTPSAVREEPAELPSTPVRPIFWRRRAS